MIIYMQIKVTYCHWITFYNYFFIKFFKYFFIEENVLIVKTKCTEMFFAEPRIVLLFEGCSNLFLEGHYPTEFTTHEVFRLQCLVMKEQWPSTCWIGHPGSMTLECQFPFENFILFIYFFRCKVMIWKVK